MLDATEAEIDELWNANVELRDDDPKGCHWWIGYCRCKGGERRASLRVKNQRKQWYASRFFWEAEYGPIPDGLLVCHHCDNPECVRLDHLYLGTHQDNVNDRVNRGRQLRGEDVPTAEMTNAKAREIMEMLANGYVGWDIVRRFDVSISTVQHIKKGRAWQQVVWPEVEVA
jgi:HNH endonuclease